MRGTFRHTMALPWVKLWNATSGKSWQALPRPHGPAITNSAGVDPDRILLVGSGIAAGFGVLSHDLGLAGCLGRAISVQTGRGTDIDVVADASRELKSIDAMLGSLDLSRFDALVLVFGTNEAFTLTSSANWERMLATAIDRLERFSPTSLPIFVVGIPPQAFDRLPGIYSRVVRRRINRLNLRSSAMCEARGARVRYVALGSSASGPGEIGSQAYVAWAAAVAPQVSEALESCSRIITPPTRVNEETRQAALDHLEIIEKPDEPDESSEALLAQITMTAKDIFGVSGAAVSVIDDQREWLEASAGIPPMEGRRAESICDFTIRTPDILVISDTLQDARFRNRPWTTSAAPIRFYAGYPIEAPDGHRVGALCVVDARPRVFTANDAILLRDLALQAQTILWTRAAT